jgi:hypothetical protein
MMERDPSHRSGLEGGQEYFSRRRLDGVRLRIAAVSLAVAAGLSGLSVPGGLGGLGVTTASADEPTSDGVLTMISTPDDPYAGGRSLSAPLTFESNSSEALLLTFNRLDGAGAVLIDDPDWVLRVATPADLSTGTSYPLNGSTDDVLQLANANAFQRTLCPSLTGSVSFDDVVTDPDGVATLLAARFVVHCTPDDTLFGAVGFNTAAPPLPDEAAPLIQAEARFPALVSVFDGETANMLAIDVRPRALLLRWDTPGGFTCADTVVDDPFASELGNYIGRDDTMAIRQLDPTSLTRVTVTMSNSETCSATAFSGQGYALVLPVVATLREPTVDRDTDQVTLRGNVKVVTPQTTEVARRVDLECRVRKPDGSIVTRAVVTSGFDGRFRASFPTRHATHVWVVIESGEEPTEPGATNDTWYHFGDASQHYSLS